MNPTEHASEPQRSSGVFREPPLQGAVRLKVTNKFG